MREAEEIGVMHSPPRRSAAHRESAQRVAVVTLPPPDNFALTSITSLPMILISELERGFVRFGSA